VVTIRSNKMELNTFSMDPVADQLSKHMQRNYPGGEYYSVYEAPGSADTDYIESLRVTDSKI